MTTNPAASARDKATPNAKVKKRGAVSLRTRLLLIFGALLLMGVLRTGFLLIIIGMLPAIIAHYMDVSRYRYTFKTILACNLAGILPSVVKLLEYGPRSGVMQEIMANGNTWFVIYGAAFMGVCMIRLMPMVALVLINGLHGTQIVRLKHNQQRIETEWGQEVTQFSKKPDDAEDDYWTF